MHEQESPEVLELEAAFGALERDIAGVSQPRGADRAMATARRRRRTTIGAIAAVAVLAAGGAAIAQGVGRDTAVGPSEQPLPPASHLSADGLGRASTGWVSGWVSASPAAAGRALDLLKPLTCLAASVPGEAMNNPERRGTAVFTSGTHTIDDVVALQYPEGHIAAASADLSTLVSRCPAAETVRRSYADGSEATYSLVRSGRGAFTIWTARYGDRLGLMVLSGAPGDPNAGTVGRMSDFLVGGLREDSTFSGRGATSSGGGSATASAGPSSAPSASPDFLGAAAFARAVQGWSSGWAPDGATKDSTTLPCGASPGGSSGEGTNLGSNGDQEIYRYGSTRAAAADLQAISRRLAGCTAASYDVHRVALADGREITVAAAPGDQGNVVWLAGRGDMVMFVVIPAGHTPPPDSVSRTVGGLLYDSLDHMRSSASGGGKPVRLGKS